jgi:hypothetical protein
MSEKPDPPVPPEVDLKDFAFTPIFRARLFGSSFHARATDAEWRAGVTLWLKCQDQVPAGSLPTDDVDLCRLAELGRDMRTWKKLKQGALHGWYECSDGKLYHDVVAEIVTEQWQRKCVQRDRTAAARAARAANRLSQSLSQTDFRYATETATETATDPVTETVTGSKGQGQGQGQGQGHKESKNLSQPALGVSEPRAREAPAGLAGWLANFEISEEWLAEAAVLRAEAGKPPVDLHEQSRRALEHWRTDPPRDPQRAWHGWALTARADRPNGTAHDGPGPPADRVQHDAPTGPPPPLPTVRH